MPGHVTAGSLIHCHVAASENCCPRTSRMANLIHFCCALLSLIDAMLEMPMSKVLDKVPLDRETKAVLLGQSSMLRPVYQLMRAYESGEWQAVSGLETGLHLDHEEVASLYRQAQQWAREVTGA